MSLKVKTLETCEISWIDGIPVIDPKGLRLVVDTGSPATFAQGGQIELAGEKHGVQQQIPLLDSVLDSDHLSGFLKELVDGLIGADLLASYRVRFNFSDNLFELAHDDSPLGGKTLPIELTVGVPIVECTINRQARRCVLDSGAKHNYIRSKLAEDGVKLGICADFHVLIGEFEAPMIELPACLTDEGEGKQSFMIAPAAVEKVLAVSNVDGIIGISWLKQFRELVISYRQECIKVI